MHQIFGGLSGKQMESNFLEPQLAAKSFYSEGLDGGQTIYSRLCRLAALVGVLLVPLFFLPWTTSVLEFNKQMLLIGFSGAVLILWLLDVVVSGKLSWRSNYVDGGVAAILGATALATLFSLTKFKSLFGLTGSLSESLVSVVALSVFYFAIVHSFNDRGRAVKMFMVVSLVLALLYGTLQLFGVYAFSLFKYVGISSFEFTKSGGFNSVGSVNALGMLAAVSLPLLYRSRLVLFRYLDLSKLGAFLSLALLIILNWWILWVVAIVGMVALIAIESVTNKLNSGEGNHFRLAKFLFPMTVIVLGVFLMVVNFNLAFLKKNLPIEVAPSFNSSGDIAFNVLKKSPALGFGPENFSLAFDRYGAHTLTNTSISGAKFFDGTSQFFNFAVGGGVVMVVALAYLLWTLGWGMFKNLNISTLKNGDTGIVSALVAVIAGLFLYPFNLTLMFLLYVLVALAVLVLWSKDSRQINIEEKATVSLVSSLGFIGGLILVLVGVYFGASIYVSDIRYVRALTSPDADKAAENLIGAINWNGYDDRYYRAASQVALSLLSQELNKKPASEDQAARVQNYMSSAINLAKRAVEVGPKEVSNYSNLGSVYRSLLGLVEGVDKLAEDAYLSAVDLRPGDASYFNEIGSMYLASADLYRSMAASGGPNAAKLQAGISPALEKSEDNFKKAIDISSNFGMAIYSLGGVYERQGRINEAISQLEKITPFNANQPSLAFELGLLYYRAGQKDKSLSELQRAIVLSPNFANARWYAALIYEERADFDSAIEQLEKIISSEENKSNETVLAKLAQLKSGKKAIPPKKVTDQTPIQ